VCASASAQSSGPPQDPTPKYKAIIAKSLRVKDKNSIEIGTDYFKDRAGIFSATARLDHVEVADSIRMVQTNYYGWAWQTCIRLNVNGFPLTYAVFISEGRVIDARSAVAVDNCDRAKYGALPVGAALR
jgi:hypothetical protein